MIINNRTFKIEPKATSKLSRKFRARASWSMVGDKRCFFRSMWEARYAKYLQSLKNNNVIKDWSHEPKTFWFMEIKRGVRSYKPDFLVENINGTHYWVEVKGFMDAKSATKIKRFRKYYPEETLQVMDEKFFRRFE